ncbi:MAG: sialate O-acetylesterase [Pirellulales bacterium]
MNECRRGQRNVGLANPLWRAAGAAIAWSIVGLLAGGACPWGASGAEPERLMLTEPTPFRVYQREGFEPRRAAEHDGGAAARGAAAVPLRMADLPGTEDAVGEYRVSAVGAKGTPPNDWQPLPAPPAGTTARMLRVPAGGWYRLEVRLRRGNEIVAAGAVEPFGVGEVFVVAGQSYATNCNDARLRVTDPAERVAACDPAHGGWRVAHDPQPAPDQSDGGSIWPAVGDLLVPVLDVPVGFLNVAYGGTSSTQWLPGGALHERLAKRGQALGRFRAVLWQQGESDVIDKTETARYVEHVQTIRAAAEKSWGFQPPWLLAKSTLHPTVYRDPPGEQRIRRGIEELCRQPGFHPGPDTDWLTGDNRGGPGSRRHFSASGQRQAATLWFAALWRELAFP